MELETGGIWPGPYFRWWHPCGAHRWVPSVTQQTLGNHTNDNVRNSSTSRYQLFLRNLQKGNIHQWFGFYKWLKRKANPSWSFLLLTLCHQLCTNSEDFAVPPLRQLGVHLPFQGPFPWLVLEVNTGYLVVSVKQPMNPDYPIAGTFLRNKTTSSHNPETRSCHSDT